MSEAVFKHVRVTGKKFERASIVLDNMWFENCSFVSVVGLGRIAIFEFLVEVALKFNCTNEDSSSNELC